MNTEEDSDTESPSARSDILSQQLSEPTEISESGNSQKNQQSTKHS